MDKGRFDCIKEQYEQLSTTEFIDWCLKMKYPIEDILEVVKKCEIGKTLATITILCGITGLLIILILLLT